MIPSFYPVRDKLDADAKERAHRNLSPAQLEILQGGRPQPFADSNSGLQTRTIAQLLASSRGVRYPDIPNFSYSDLLQREVENQNASPFTADAGPFWNASNRPRIAVVGGGMSGLLSAWQLGKLGAQVDLWEASPPPNGMVLNPQGAGRIRPINIIPGNQSTRVELGAMRFPDTSHLFWHYLSLILPELRAFTEFPNPGKIPTFLSGDNTLSATWDNVGLGLDTGPDNNINYRDLQQRHLNAFLNVRPAANGLTLGQVSEIMLSGTASSAQINMVNSFWALASRHYYGISYRDFLLNRRFSSNEIQAIGFIGLGTGGFSPLFNTSVLDVMRLVVWNYAAEYAVPDLYLYPWRLLQRVSGSTNGGTVNYNREIRGAIWEASSGRYFLIDANGAPMSARYDYLVIAMSHRAAQRLLARTDVPSPPLPNRRPFSLGRSSQFRTDIELQQAIASIKIFQTAGGPASSSPLGQFSSINPPLTTPLGRSVRAIFGRSGNHPVGVTYMLPPVNQNFGSAQFMLGLQYSWGADSIDLRQGFLAQYPAVNVALNSNGVFMGRDLNVANGVAETLADRVRGKVMRPHVVNGQTHPNFFSPTRVGAGSFEGSMAIVDWNSVPNINMGFKLDAPSRGLLSINQFKRTARFPGVTLTDAWDSPQGVDVSAARIYFAGCSFSHYGGWVEGAFQSALNAVAGVVYDAARTTGQLGRLSPRGRELVEGGAYPFQAGRGHDQGDGNAREHDHGSEKVSVLARQPH